MKIKDIMLKRRTLDFEDFVAGFARLEEDLGRPVALKKPFSELAERFNMMWMEHHCKDE